MQLLFVIEIAPKSPFLCEQILYPILFSCRCKSCPVQYEDSLSLCNLRLRANGRSIVGYYMLRLFAHPVACCWMLLRVVAQSLKPVILLAPCKRT